MLHNDENLKEIVDACVSIVSGEKSFPISIGYFSFENKQDLFKFLASNKLLYTRCGLHLKLRAKDESLKQGIESFLSELLLVQPK